MQPQVCPDWLWLSWGNTTPQWCVISPNHTSSLQTGGTSERQQCGSLRPESIYHHTQHCCLKVTETVHMRQSHRQWCRIRDDGIRPLCAARDRIATGPATVLCISVQSKRQLHHSFFGGSHVDSEQIWHACCRWSWVSFNLLLSYWKVATEGFLSDI